MKTKRILPLFLCALFVGTALCGCAQGETEQVNDSLSVYFGYGGSTFGSTNGLLEEQAQSVLKSFRSLHPDITVTVYDPMGDDPGISQDTAMQKLSSDLMGGRGPDLLFLDARFYDLYKWFESGIFADLTPLMESDAEFQAVPRNEAIPELCKWKGKQYVFPYFYDVGEFFTTEEALNGFGADGEKLASPDSFLEEAERFTSQNPGTPFYWQWESPRPSRLFWLQYSGLFDLEKKDVHLDSAGLERRMKLERQWYEANPRIPYPGNDLDELEYLNTFPLGKFALWEQHTSSLYLDDISRLGVYGTPMHIPVENEEGGMTALIMECAGIRNNSPNRQNAWEFLKLAEQSLVWREQARPEQPLTWVAVPVSTEALENSLQRETEMALSRSLTFPEYAPLPEGFTESYREDLERVNHALLFYEPYDRLLKSFQPYVEGKTDYEACKKDAEENLALYLSE